MSIVTAGAAMGGTWWRAPEYHEGELCLPGQSRLDINGRKLLETIGARAEQGLLDIPPMPKAALEAVKLIKSEDADLAAVAACIQLDPVLTALVLRHANSAFYGPRYVIDTVTQAVSFVGLRRIKELLLGAALKRVTSELRARRYAEMEWHYAVHCASIAKTLGTLLKLDEEQCYVAGLLHEIGRLPVLQALEARGALPEPPQPDSDADIILECLHRGVGLQVAKKWEQPPAVCDAIASHLNGRQADEDSRAQFPSTRVAEAASDLCFALGLGRFKRPFAILQAQSLKDLDFGPKGVESFLSHDIPRILSEVSDLL